MSVIEIAPKSDFVALEGNYYTLTLENYKIRDKDPDKYHTTPWRDVEFTWDVEVPDEVRQRLGLGTEQITRRSWAAVPKTCSDKATLIIIGVALGKINIASAAEAGLRFDPDTWLGAKCRGNIIEKTKADGTIVDDIDGYSPMPKARAGARQAVPAPRPEPTPVFEDDDSMLF